MATGVVIAGGGPNGLLLACELALAGVRPIVLERLPERAALPKANGLVGQVVQALDYRGLYERFSGSSAPPAPAPRFQFGALPLELSSIGSNALYTLPIPQRRMEELLEQRAHELGVEIRRGHELTTVSQDGEQVSIGVSGPRGPYELAAEFLVGADGGHSVVRKLCGIEFPGITDRGFVGAAARSPSTLRLPFRAAESWKWPGRAGCSPRHSPAPRTACSPTGCSSRACIGWPCTSGHPRRWRTAHPCRSMSCGTRCAGCWAATCR